MLQNFTNGVIAVALLVQFVVASFYGLAALAVWGAFTEAPLLSKALWAALLASPLLSLVIAIRRPRRGRAAILFLTVMQLALVVLAMVI